MSETYIVVPDLHFPYADVKYCDVVTQLIELLEPDGLIQLGDLVDFWQLSKFLKNPARRNTVANDLEMAYRFLSHWLKRMPDGSVVHLLEGNHEYRLQKYIWGRAPELAEIVPSVPQLLEVDEWETDYGVRGVWHPYEHWKSCMLGDTLFHHGVYFNKYVSAKQVDAYPFNLVTGHTHRYQEHCNGRQWSVTLGHGSRSAEIAHLPIPFEWDQRVGLFTLVDGRGELESYRIVDGVAVVRGVKLIGVDP